MKKDKKHRGEKKSFFKKIAGELEIFTRKTREHWDFKKNDANQKMPLFHHNHHERILGLNFGFEWETHENARFSESLAAFVAFRKFDFSTTTDKKKQHQSQQQFVAAHTASAIGGIANEC